jgi:hypothetical protein
MKSLLLVCLTAIALVAAPAVAMAGGGSKATGSIKVQNNSGLDLMVIVASQNSQLNNLNALLNGSTPPTEAQVRTAATKDGAKVIVVNDGNSGTVTGLKVGNYQVLAADIDAGTVGVNFADSVASNVAVAKGQTKTVTIGDLSSPE